MSEQGDIQEGDDTTQDAQQTNGAEVEAKAREMGWVPQTEWKGDPDKWRAADEFVQRGEELLPIVKSQLRKSQDRVAELEKVVNSNAETVKRLERMTETALKQREQQIRDEYEGRREKAVETGDTEAYKAANAAEKAALKALETEKPDAAAKTPEAPPEVQAWVAENPWFTTDKRLARHASRFLDDVMEEMPAADLATQLAEVKTRMTEAYPTQFGVKTNGNAGSRVEGGTRTPGGNGTGASLYAKLPADAKTQADKFIDDGLFLQKGETAEKNRAQARERYAKTYLETPA